MKAMASRKLVKTPEIFEYITIFKMPRNSNNCIKIRHKNLEGVVWNYDTLGFQYLGIEIYIWTPGTGGGEGERVSFGGIKQKRGGVPWVRQIRRYEPPPGNPRWRRSLMFNGNLMVNTQLHMRTNDWPYPAVLENCGVQQPRKAAVKAGIEGKRNTAHGKAVSHKWRGHGTNLVDG